MYIFSFNFVLCRDLVMTVNIPVQERNKGMLACRIVASAGSSTCQYVSPITNRLFAYSMVLVPARYKVSTDARPGLRPGKQGKGVCHFLRQPKEKKEIPSLVPDPNCSTKP